MFKLFLVSGSVLVATAAYASGKELTCTYFTDAGRQEQFIFGDNWAVHQYRGVDTGKPAQSDFECWDFPPPYTCWNYENAPRYKVLSLEKGKIVIVYGNVESTSRWPPHVVYYDVECDKKLDFE